METAAGSKAYQDADAIRIFDAWWPRLVRASSSPGSATDLLPVAGRRHADQRVAVRRPDRADVSDLPTSANEAQAHKGSSFQYGWWGYVDKDLRATLGDRVRRLARPQYCGGGAVGRLPAARC